MANVNNEDKDWRERVWAKFLFVAVAAGALAALIALLWPTIQMTLGSWANTLSRFEAVAIAALTFSVIGLFVYFVAEKTLWNLLELLIVPLALAGIGLWFTAQQDARQQQVEEQRTQDATLQTYLDQMSSLMIGKNSLRASEEDSEVRTLARARTLTVMRRVDATRKSEVMQFLVEAKLVQRAEGKDPIIDLSGADLRSADLDNTQLSGADMTDANLSGADLSDADLFGANLRGAELRLALLNGTRLRGAYLTGVDLTAHNLSDANLIFAVLDRADLSWVQLSDANLSGAHMRSADLSDAILVNVNLSDAHMRGANLSDAILEDADLRDATLTSIKGVTSEELAQQAASLKGATMPNGQKYEDWLRDKESRGADGEGSSPS